MQRLSQFGIAVTILGVVVAFIGFFPGVVGLEQLPGVGVLQVLVILGGFAVMIAGAYVFVQSTFYPGVKHNLIQQVGIRLSLTGMVIATASGLADILGFGSNPPLGGDQRPYLGPFQVAGLVGGFLVASLGVALFSAMGPPGPHGTDEDSET